MARDDIAIIDPPPFFAPAEVWQAFLEEMLGVRRQFPTKQVDEAIADARAILAEIEGGEDQILTPEMRKQVWEDLPR